MVPWSVFLQNIFYVAPTRNHTPAGKFLKWGKTLPARAISDLLVLRPKKPHSLCAKFEMKNANIFVDVDLTLVDANYKLLAGATEALTELKEKRCHLFLWSTNGADYAGKIAQLHKLTDLFEGFSAKPDIIIDDQPGTVLNPFIFDVNAETSWPSLADKIISKHID